MNRLTSYFKSRDLVKLHLGHAEDFLHKGNLEKALRHMISGNREMLISQNCLVSLAFDHARRKKGKKPARR